MGGALISARTALSNTREKRRTRLPAPPSDSMCSRLAFHTYIVTETPRRSSNTPAPCHAIPVHFGRFLSYRVRSWYSSAANPGGIGRGGTRWSTRPTMLALVATNQANRAEQDRRLSWLEQPVGASGEPNRKHRQEDQQQKKHCRSDQIGDPPERTRAT